MWFSKSSFFVLKGMTTSKSSWTQKTSLTRPRRDKRLKLNERRKKQRKQRSRNRKSEKRRNEQPKNTNAKQKKHGKKRPSKSDKERKQKRRQPPQRRRQLLRPRQTRPQYPPLKHYHQSRLQAKSILPLQQLRPLHLRMSQSHPRMTPPAERVGPKLLAHLQQQLCRQGLDRTSQVPCHRCRLNPVQTDDKQARMHPHLHPRMMPTLASKLARVAPHRRPSRQHRLNVNSVLVFHKMRHWSKIYGC